MTGQIMPPLNNSGGNNSGFDISGGTGDFPYTILGTACRAIDDYGVARDPNSASKGGAGILTSPSFECEKALYLPFPGDSGKLLSIKGYSRPSTIGDGTGGDLATRRYSVQFNIDECVNDAARTVLVTNTFNARIQDTNSTQGRHGTEFAIALHDDKLYMLVDLQGTDGTSGTKTMKRGFRSIIYDIATRSLVNETANQTCFNRSGINGLPSTVFSSANTSFNPIWDKTNREWVLESNHFNMDSRLIRINPDARTETVVASLQCRYDNLGNPSRAQVALSNRCTGVTGNGYSDFGVGVQLAGYYANAAGGTIGSGGNRWGHIYVVTSEYNYAYVYSSAGHGFGAQDYDEFMAFREACCDLARIPTS